MSNIPRLKRYAPNFISRGHHEFRQKFFVMRVPYRTDDNGWVYYDDPENEIELCGEGMWPDEFVSRPAAQAYIETRKDNDSWHRMLGAYRYIIIEVYI